MSATEHPFLDDRIAAVAGDRGVDEDDLDDALLRVQRAIAREDSESEYEYSSQHNFGWQDEDAYYLYGDGIWGTLRDELSLSADLLDAAREVHRRVMVESAEARDERESLDAMFADGTEPLVVTSTAEDPPLYGQDI